MYNEKRVGHTTMGLDMINIILLRGIREDCLGMLNLMGKGDISKEYFENIIDLRRRYSRGSSRTNKREKLEWDSFDRTQKSSNGGATRAEIGNILKKFKIDMMSSISSEIDVLREKQKQALEYLTLCVFYPRCRKKHPVKECPLDKVEVWRLYELNHDTKECPSLPQSEGSYVGINSRHGTSLLHFLEKALAASKPKYESILVDILE